MPEPSPVLESLDNRPWYAGISRYQWIVLAIAAAGWAFDQYESQVFVMTKDSILKSLDITDKAELNSWTDYLYTIFLVGSATGGLLAGTLADKFGRRPMLIVTILFYSVFSGMSYFVTARWELCVLRFLIAMGIGGEWAVGAALVAETFPKRARAYTSGIFHSSSVIGIWMATLVGIVIGSNWRYAYLIGILPALLTIWVRIRVKEPEKWQEEAEKLQESGSGRKQLGSFKELLGTPMWRRRALLGCALAAIGLATFWGVMVAGSDLTRDFLTHAGYSSEEVSLWTKITYGFVQMSGAAVGMLLFARICARFGRRPAFIAFHIMAFIIVPITCFLPQTFWQLLIILPIFAFFVQSFHAGYAIYFPELFPTHLRATGTSFCFNGGRFGTVPMMLLSAWFKGQGIEVRWAVTWMGTLFLVGAVIMLFLPETKGQDLPE
jgi:MFS family permease